MERSQLWCSLVLILVINTQTVLMKDVQNLEPSLDELHDFPERKWPIVEKYGTSALVSNEKRIIFTATAVAIGSAIAANAGAIATGAGLVLGAAGVAAVLADRATENAPGSDSAEKLEGAVVGENDEAFTNYMRDMKTMLDQYGNKMKNAELKLDGLKHVLTDFTSKYNNDRSIDRAGVKNQLHELFNAAEGLKQLVRVGESVKLGPYRVFRGAGSKITSLEKALTNLNRELTSDFPLLGYMSLAQWYYGKTRDVKKTTLFVQTMAVYQMQGYEFLKLLYIAECQERHPGTGEGECWAKRKKTMEHYTAKEKRTAQLTVTIRECPRCRNGGYCVNGRNPTCKCSADWYGTLCENSRWYGWSSWRNYDTQNCNWCGSAKKKMRRTKQCRKSPCRSRTQQQFKWVSCGWRHCYKYKTCWRKKWYKSWWSWKYYWQSYSCMKRVWGEPHFKTEDGKHFDFQGTCSYYYATDRARSFNITIQNSQCGTIEGKANRPVSCIEKVLTSIGSTTFALEKDLSLNINGAKTKLPFSNTNVDVHEANEEFVQVSLANNISFQWNGEEIALSIPLSLGRNSPDYLIYGLTGTYNNNTDDDFTGPDGSLKSDANEFGKSWQVPGSCVRAQKRGKALDVFRRYQQKIKDNNLSDESLSERELKNERESKSVELAEEMCSEMKSDIFGKCNDTADFSSVYNGCVLDMSTCNRNMRDCKCPAFEAYAEYCADLGQEVGNWRSKVTECAKECTNGDIFRNCASPCQRTCEHIQRMQTNAVACTDTCVEGCACPDGMTRDVPGKDGVCIKMENCNCMHGNEYFKKDDMAIIDGKSCICNGVIWLCKQPSAP